MSRSIYIKTNQRIVVPGTKMIRRIITGAILFLFWNAFGACTKTDTSASPPVAGGRTVIQILRNSFNVSLFNAALNYTGLADSLSGAGPYTIFAPDDAAFDSMGISTVAQIEAMDKARLTHLLKYHILYGQKIALADIDRKPNNPFTNWDNLNLYISRPFDNTTFNNHDITKFLSVNGDTVIQEDILATNGVVHTLKNVLKYETFHTCADFLNANPNYSTFVTALKNFNLFGQLQSTGPMTVFAPTNSAFTAAGIGPGDLSLLDTLHFIKLLFTPYICPRLRFFTTDLVDFVAPFNYYPPGNGFTISMSYGSIYPNPPLLYVGATGLDPVTHDLIPLTANVNNSGAYCNLVDIDNPAGNGVVQGINNLMALPSFCAIHP
jgi:uncharacterized surface protein with fasciclin (FAS1) repeats